MFLSDFVLSHFYSLLIGTSATVRELTVYYFKPECFETLPMPKLRNLTLCNCSAPFTNTMFANKSLVKIDASTWYAGTIDFRKLSNLRDLIVRNKFAEERFRNWNCNQLERVTVMFTKVTIFIMLILWRNQLFSTSRSRICKRFKTQTSRTFPSVVKKKKIVFAHIRHMTENLI